MRRCIASFAFLIFCTASAYSQEAGQALDYGVRVNIDSEYETSLDLSYREDPNTFDMRVTGFDLSYPVWTPEGDRIYYSDHFDIFSIPITGGKPRLEYEGILLYPYNGKRFVLHETILSLVGISPDGKKLYFRQNLIGEGSGAQITITEHFDENGKLVGWGGRSSGGDDALQCLDLETGTVTTVVHNVWESTLGRSGKYLEYLTWGTKTTHILDLETGDDWTLPILSHAVSFTDNDQNLLYLVPNNGMCKFFKIPIRGGEPQEIPALGVNIGSASYPVSLDWHPEGEWAIHALSTGEASLSNISAGITVQVLPSSNTIDVLQLRFSPDGKQICFIRRDANNNATEWAIYIKDISPFLNSEFPVSVADAAPKGFALTGNYPNPFNPSTHLSFTLPSSGAAQVTVYDITGRTVRNLVSSTLSAGAHEMVWDGRDNSGATVSSGTYIARLKMGNLTASHRMMLMK